MCRLPFWAQSPMPHIEPYAPRITVVWSLTRIATTSTELIRSQPGTLCPGLALNRHGGYLNSQCKLTLREQVTPVVNER